MTGRLGWRLLGVRAEYGLAAPAGSDGPDDDDDVDNAVISLVP